MKLLVVEDERDLNLIIVKKLRAEGYSVDFCFDGESALDYLAAVEYDGVVLDVLLPKINGFQVLKEIRDRNIQVPVLFLTACTDTDDIVSGLDAGADDYVTKPFSFHELLARIRVMIRKRVETRENVYQCGDLILNYNDRTVKRAGKDIDLSAREFAILFYMIRNQNIVLTREQIENNIWNMDYEGSSNIIDVYIRYLRKKVDDGFETKMIQTIRGAGYMLKWEDKNKVQS
ncbi:MAG: response regulator transcription factor [Lachnospiraceae bacterium]|nr:response regulator transcription factor [Lachnospiraceae bacterium]